VIARVAISERCRPGGEVNEDYLAFLEAGAGGIGLVERNFGSGHDPEALFHFIESGLKATTAEPAIETILPPTGVATPANVGERLGELARSVRRFAVFDPLAVVVGSGPAGPLDPDEARDLLVTALQQVTRTAARLHPRGIPLGLDISADDALVASVPDAEELIDEVGEPGLRIVLRADRVLGDEQDIEDAIASADRIGCVRIPVSLLGKDSSAALGELAKLIAGLTAARYQGFYELVPEGAPESIPTARLGEAVRRLSRLHDEAQSRNAEGVHGVQQS
jgi:sugar phosphate isomerase/epimerase